MQLQKENLGKVAITIEEGYWDINKDYDKLTIVEKEGTFGTFISRKPVPAGVTLTDRKYWIPFSSLKEEILLNYNAFIAKYGNIIEEINNTIEDHTSTINEHTETINEHSNSIEEILKSKQQWENKVLYINITYNELVEKRNAKLLIPGVNYRIIDYDTIAEGHDVNDVFYKSAMHPFDIIVQAIDNSTLSRQAKAAKSKRDVNNYFDAEDLAGWQIWYSLDNDTKYDWAQEDAKGIIYRMIDSNNNDIPYDFKNIMFERTTLSISYEATNTTHRTSNRQTYFLYSGTSIYYDNVDSYTIQAPIGCDNGMDGVLGIVMDYTYAYTFNHIDKDGNYIDASNSNIYSSNIYNNKITLTTGDNFALPNIVFVNLYPGVNRNNKYYVTFTDIFAYNNEFVDCTNCTFMNVSNSTIINCYSLIVFRLSNSNLERCNYILSSIIYDSTLNYLHECCPNYIENCSLKNSSVNCYAIKNSKIEDSDFSFYLDEKTLIDFTEFCSELDKCIITDRITDFNDVSLYTVYGDKTRRCFFKYKIEDNTIMKN